MKTTIIPDDIANSQEQNSAWLAKQYRKLVFRQLQAIQHGRITIQEGQQSWTFGQTTRTCKLHVKLRVNNADLYANIIFGGSIAAGETYIRGYWTSDNLTSLVRIFVLNREVLMGMEKGLAKLLTPLSKLAHRFNRNSKRGSSRNIQAHYDIGNDLFQLFLDKSMMYSSAIYPYQNSTLEEAATHKLDIICRKLDLQADDHLLEIGTGWGGLAMHAAQHYGCKVTTTTISKEQYELAKERVSQAGLSDRIELLMQDYRDLSGQYDKLVSVEMIEAVGYEYYDTFFNTCSKLLKPDGMMLLQSITIADQFYADAKRSVDFIQRYIFPGGCLPSISTIMDAVARVTDMRLHHMDEFGKHYAQTLVDWRQRFFQHLEEIKTLGYPDTFIRMWEYYLCYCEGGFLENSIGVTHMLFCKPHNHRRAVLLDNINTAHENT